MAEISDWSVTAGDNNSAPPDGFPEGMAYSDVNNSGREVMAVLARLYADTNGTLETAGAADAYTLTPNRTVSSLTDGLVFRFKVHATNTGEATLDVGGIGPKNIVAPDDSALGAGNLTAGGIYEVAYVSAVDKFILVGMATGTLTVPGLTVSGDAVVTGDISGATISGDIAVSTGDLTSTDKAATPALVGEAATVIGAPHAYFGDRKAQGTAGGSVTANTWTGRDLNTEFFDPFDYITISGNAFTVAHDGVVEVRCPAYSVNFYNSRLVRISDSAVIDHGTTEYTNGSVGMMTHSTILAEVEAGEEYKIEIITHASRATNGLGFPADKTGVPETYTTVKYWRAS